MTVPGVRCGNTFSISGLAMATQPSVGRPSTQQWKNIALPAPGAGGASLWPKTTRTSYASSSRCRLSAEKRWGNCTGRLYSGSPSPSDQPSLGRVHRHGKPGGVSDVRRSRRSRTPRIGQVPSGVHPSPSRLSEALQTPPFPMEHATSMSPKRSLCAMLSTSMTLTTDARYDPASWQDSGRYAGSLRSLTATVPTP